MKESKLLPCYSVPMRDFLTSKGIRYELVGLHPKSHKMFWVYMPTHFTSRIENLLNLCGLRNRIIEDDGTNRSLDDSIDYEKVNSILNIERDKFHKFINDNMI